MISIGFSAFILKLYFRDLKFYVDKSAHNRQVTFIVKSKVHNFCKMYQLLMEPVGGHIVVCKTQKVEGKFGSRAVAMYRY